jgi:hypothetical protein
MLRTILALVIAAHGIGHILFLVPLLGIADWGQSSRSWLLTGDAARLIGSMVWVAALVTFAVAAFGLFGQQTWWRNAAIIAAFISIAGLILFWTTPVTAPALLALVFNLLVLGALVLVHWPSIEAVGA